jgi:hypothetical protein
LFITGNGEIFPAELGLDVIRRDREGDAHGGVLIASKSEYGLIQVNASKEAEMITGSIKLGNKQLMITSYYRPPNKQDIKYVESTICMHLLICRPSRCHGRCFQLVVEFYIFQHVQDG